jgi:hypothetical protein
VSSVQYCYHSDPANRGVEAALRALGHASWDYSSPAWDGFSHDENQLLAISDQAFDLHKRKWLQARQKDAFNLVLAVENIYRTWEEGRDKRLTQLVFCDLSTPNPDKFNVCDDIRDKLIAKDVPGKPGAPPDQFC